MAIPTWNPPVTPSQREQSLLKRMLRVRKFLAFLRLQRHALFDASFQAELAAVYRDTGAGKEPIPPARLALACLLQGYLQVSDAALVELTVVDLQVQMVLDCLGEEKPAFSQGAFADFRSRLIAHDLDRRLLERTVELAKQTKGFDFKKVPASLRLGIDSRPLEGAGKVEDTFNLLGHAGRKLAECAAELAGRRFEEVCREAGIPLLLAPSIKGGLDVDWGDEAAEHEALQELLSQLSALQSWINQHLREQTGRPPLKPHLQTVQRLREQDLEPDPGGGGGIHIKEGVAQDRQISVEDPQMRHGRKSKHHRFNGYKQYLATDLDHDLNLAAEVLPANLPEALGAEGLARDLARQGLEATEAYMDRAFVGSVVVQDTLKRGGKVVCRPFDAPNGEHLRKRDFVLDLRAMTIACPGGQVLPIELGKTVRFEAKVCDECPVRKLCTGAERGRGRSVHISEDERLQQRLRKRAATGAGRKELRERVGVEHQLAHLSQRQGKRARYRGVRKNLFDLRRIAAVQNLETLQRRFDSTALAKAA